jgi:hypothetical protein
MTGSAASYDDCQLYTSAPLSGVQAGLMLAIKPTTASNSPNVVGFYNSVPNATDRPIAGWHIRYDSGGPRPAWTAWVAITTGYTHSQPLITVTTDTGALWFINDGTVNRLVWCLTPIDAPLLTPNLLLSRYHASLMTIDYVMVRQLGEPFTSHYAVTSQSVDTAISGTSYTTTANAIHDLTVTAPDPLANTCELRYRVLDDNNYWTAYFDAAGAFKVDSVAAGVATNRISSAAAIAAGETRTIRAMCDGTKHNHYSFTSTISLLKAGETNVSHLDAQTAVKPVAGAGWTLGALRSFPVTADAYAELSNDLP